VTLWTSLLGASVRYLDAAGVRTRIASLGSGPPVVLLHGRGGHLETFAATLPGLAAAGRTAIAVDLLGHGLTGRSADADYRVPALAAHVGAVLDTLGLSRVDLIGQSLGGWVAALLAPERADRLVLIEPAGLQPEGVRLAQPHVAAAYARGGRAFEEPTVDAVRGRLAGLLADPAAVDEELVAVRAALYAPAAAREVHRLVRAADNAPWLLTPERLSTLTVPTLFVRGEDGHTPPDVVRAAVDAMPDARLHTVAAAKQWPQFEQPAVVTSLISRFLDERTHHDVLG